MFISTSSRRPPTASLDYQGSYLLWFANLLTNSTKSRQVPLSTLGSTHMCIKVCLSGYIDTMSTKTVDKPIVAHSEEGVKFI